MLRYIKTNDQWYDTLRELKEKHRVLMLIDNQVLSINEDNSETIIGYLQEEQDNEPSSN